jgi:ubiquinol-cytochrome c reductase core subunit 2
LKLEQKSLLGNVPDLAINSAHGLAFHKGLGSPLYPTSSTPLQKYLNANSISQFANSAYTKSNIAVVANGADQAELSKWVGEYFTNVKSSASSLPGDASKYYGGEERIAHGSGNSYVIAFPGSSSFTSGSSYKPEIAVLAALLGGQSTIKWSPGFSLLSKASASFPGANTTTTHYSYSDAGLLAIQFTGSASAIRSASVEAVKTLKTISEGSISKEDFTKAVALAKYRALEEGQNLEAGVVATGAGLIHGGQPFQIDQVGKAVEAVSVEKLKAVCTTLTRLLPCDTDSFLGRQVITGGQGYCLSRGRSLRSPLRRGDWLEGIKWLYCWVGGWVVSTAPRCTVDNKQFLISSKLNL